MRMPQEYYNAWARAFTKKHPEVIKERVRRYREKNKDRIAKEATARRQLMRDLKDHPCEDCKQRFPPCAMDFDHVTGIKSFTIAQVAINRSLQVVIDEILKCDFVCANCHRIRTHARRQAARYKAKEASQKA